MSPKPKNTKRVREQQGGEKKYEQAEREVERLHEELVHCQSEFLHLKRRMESEALKHQLAFDALHRDYWALPARQVNNDLALRVAELEAELGEQGVELERLRHVEHDNHRLRGAIARSGYTVGDDGQEMFWLKPKEKKWSWWRGNG